MRSRSEFVLLADVSATAALAPPLEGLDFGVGIFALTRITDAGRGAGDSGWRNQNLYTGDTEEHRANTSNGQSSWCYRDPSTPLGMTARRRFCRGASFRCLRVRG